MIAAATGPGTDAQALILVVIAGLVIAVATGLLPRRKR